jgi:glutaryl-CoA dehydrogenase
MRASVTSELYLDEVVVPDAQRLEVAGFGGALACLNQARYGIAWGVLGAGFACLEEAVAYVSDRPSFGRRWRPSSSCRRASPTCSPT